MICVCVFFFFLINLNLSDEFHIAGKSELERAECLKISVRSQPCRLLSPPKRALPGHRCNFEPEFYARVGQRAICHDWKQNQNKSEKTGSFLIPFSFPWHISCLQPPQDGQSLPCPLKKWAYGGWCMRRNRYAKSSIYKSTSNSMQMAVQGLV